MRTGGTRTKEELFYLIYASMMREDFSDAEWLGMIEKFQAKNARIGITGMLLHQEGAIVQAIEGGQAAVEALYAVIQADPRHQKVQTLVALPVTQRQFPSRWMGIHRFTDEDIDLNAIEDQHPDLPSGDGRFSWQACFALRLLARFRDKP